MVAPAAGSGAAPAGRPSRSGCGYAAGRSSPVATPDPLRPGTEERPQRVPHRSHPHRVHSIDQSSSSRSGRAITASSRCPQSRATYRAPPPAARPPQPNRQLSACIRHPSTLSLYPPSAATISSRSSWSAASSSRTSRELSISSRGCRIRSARWWSRAAADRASSPRRRRPAATPPPDPRRYPERLQQHRRRSAAPKPPATAAPCPAVRPAIRPLPERRERLRASTCPFQVSGLDAGAQFRQRPLRPGFGARRERPVQRPHHDRGPAVPPVQRVAVVADVALIFGLVGHQVCARGGGTHLGVGDLQRYRLAARAVRVVHQPRVISSSISSLSW